MAKKKEKAKADEDKKAPRAPKDHAAPKAAKDHAPKAAKDHAPKAAKDHAPEAAAAPEPIGPARLQKRYGEEIVPRLAERLGRKNRLALPRLQKIVVNMGVGRATQDKAILEEVSGHLAQITGQKPLITKAKKAVSGFKLREGNPIGAMVTLRGKRMYEFMDRLISIALPRIRDFRGLNPDSFDGNGNYSMGVTEQVVFPEVDPDKVNNTQGMHITFVTNTRSDDEARELLKEFGMPFRTAS